MSAERVKTVLREAPRGADVALLGNLGGECEGSKFHNPRPLTVSPFNLTTAIEIPEFALSDMVNLCGTCRDNLKVYLTVRYEYDGDTPQAVRRDFGNTIRELGDRAWAHYADSTTGGVSSA